MNIQTGSKTFELPSLKLTANAPENGWLEYDRFLLGQKADLEGRTVDGRGLGICGPMFHIWVWGSLRSKSFIVKHHIVWVVFPPMLARGKGSRFSSGSLILKI